MAAVVAAHPLAARAGADMLVRGGNAVDAAIAAAFALAVVDPQNCGIGGHGGAMLVQPTAQGAVTLVDFNTRVPAGFATQRLAEAERCGPFVVSGVSVAVPAVIAGLECAHRTFGKLSFAALIEPAIALARDGHTVGNDLAHALAWAAENHSLSAAFKAVFFRDASPPAAGSPLRQPDLARTLERIAQEGVSAFHRGPLASAVCECVTANGGQLSVSDLERVRVEVCSAEVSLYAGANVYGPRSDATGYGIVRDALAMLDTASLGANRSAQYVSTLVGALRAAWAKRREKTTALAAGHTTHLCACDADGMLVSMTFTHGPTWFGSGLIAPGTGIVLNSGANLFVRPIDGGEPYSVHNMSPVIVEDASGSRHAIGSPGGPKIPAIVVQLIVDAIHYRLPPAEAIALPRVSVTPDGRIEAEPALLPVISRGLAPRMIERSEYYGPASALSLDAEGHAHVALDPRFSPGIAGA